MCGLCGALGQSDWTNRSASPAVFSGASRAQAERQQMASLITRVLATEGLRLSAWQANGFILRNSTGKQVLVNSLGQAWGEAERMLGRPLDPLSPKVMAVLAAQ